MLLHTAAERSFAMRADGKRLKNTDPMYTVAAHIMNKRVDAMNMVTLDIPYDPIQNYLNEKRHQGIAISHMSVIIAAYLRTEYDNGTMSKMYFNMTDTIFDVNEKINKYVTDNREVPEKNGTEKMIKFLLSVPGVLRVGVGLFRFMDKHGLLPKTIIDMSPFHNSLCISNLASIRTNHIYHHCYEFGTTSVFITMGNLREVPRRHGDEIIFDRCIPLGVVMDERICSGSYFALAFRRIRQYLRNPKLLETPPEVIKEDPAK